LGTEDNGAFLSVSTEGFQFTLGELEVYNLGLCCIARAGT